MAIEENDFSPTVGTTMTKADLVDILFDRMGLSKREAKLLVDVFFDASVLLPDASIQQKA